MRQNRKRARLLAMLADLAVASLQTIAWRSWMMACGTCSRTEYRRMTREKVAAAQKSARALLLSRDPVAVMEPWHGGATRNAKRLGRRRRR